MGGFLAVVHLPGEMGHFPPWPKVNLWCKSALLSVDIGTGKRLRIWLALLPLISLPPGPDLHIPAPFTLILSSTTHTFPSLLFPNSATPCARFSCSSGSLGICWHTQEDFLWKDHFLLLINHDSIIFYICIQNED